MFTVSSEIQNRFFDRQKVIESIGRANARRLGRIGAFVQRRAKTDVLRRGGFKKVSTGNTGRDASGRFLKQFVKRRAMAAPGKPPLVHSRDKTANLRNIQFGLHDDDAGVVIGPLKLNQKNLFVDTNMTVPQLLEFGGNVRVREYRWPNTDTWLPGAPRRSRSDVERRTRNARYSPHPFMGPSLDKEIAAGTVDSVWSSGYGS